VPIYELGVMLRAPTEVVALVGVDFLGPLARPSLAWSSDRFHGVHEFFENYGVVHVGGREHHSEGHAVAVGQEVTLGAGLPTVGRIQAYCVAPLFATTLAESRLEREQSMRPDHPSRSSRMRCKRRHTPALCQSRRRLQHVTPLTKPISLSSMLHGMPLLRT
jgi:hypothetical protein